jgi:hypothetical protein
MRDWNGAHRVKVIEDTFTYDRGWQERWWDLASSATDAEWLMYIDADEAIHEDDAPRLRELMKQPEIGLIRFPFIHFYATKDYRIHMPLTHNTRLGRRSAGYRMRNWCSDERPKSSACAMVLQTPNGERSAHTWPGKELVNVDATFYHYGWCRDARALSISQAKHKAWYADGAGLEDGNLPEVTPYDFRLADRLVDGRVECWEPRHHPGAMDGWFIDHQEAWAELEVICV